MPKKESSIKKMEEDREAKAFFNLWIFQIERWHRRERGKVAREIWASAPPEETQIGGTAFEEAAEERSRKSEQEARQDGTKSSKASDQARAKKTNQSCFRKKPGAVRCWLFCFRLSKTLKKREDWFEEQLQKKIGNYDKRSKNVKCALTMIYSQEEVVDTGGLP